MKQAKAFAFTIILVMMVANFVMPKPVVPTLPHKSWHWLKPWPVRMIESARAPVRESKIATAETIQDINERIILVLIGVVAGELVENFLELNLLLFDLLRDWAPSPDNGGGGGGDPCQACDF